MKLNKFKKTNNLAEIYSKNTVVEMAFVAKKGNWEWTQLHEEVQCKDFLNDVLLCVARPDLVDSIFPIYGFRYSFTKNPIDTDKTRISLFHSKDHIDRVESNLGFLHQIEAWAGMELSEIHRIDDDHVVIEGDREWTKTILHTSIYTLSLRALTLGSVQFDGDISNYIKNLDRDNKPWETMGDKFGIQWFMENLSAFTVEGGVAGVKDLDVAVKNNTTNVFHNNGLQYIMGLKAREGNCPGDLFIKNLGEMKKARDMKTREVKSAKAERSFRVFVYGTLKKGHGNHLVITGAVDRKEDTLTAGYTLHDLGEYPAAAKRMNSISTIKGELYTVSEKILARMDQLEGFPGYYSRSKVVTDSGEEALMYWLKGAYKKPEIKSGEWL